MMQCTNDQQKLSQAYHKIQMKIKQTMMDQLKLKYEMFQNKMLVLGKKYKKMKMMYHSTRKYKIVSKSRLK